MSRRYDLTVYQGETFDLLLRLKNENGTPFDLTGWQVRGQIRKTRRSVDVVANFEFVISNPITGEIQVILPFDVTEAIPAGETVSDLRSRYVYDIEIFNSQTNVVKRILEGYVRVSPEVTKRGI